MELVLIVARNRPEVFESLSRQCAELEGVRVVMDRREADAETRPVPDRRTRAITLDLEALGFAIVPASRPAVPRDRKSTRLNSSHLVISYAVFCLKKKNK